VQTICVTPAELAVAASFPFSFILASWSVYGMQVGDGPPAADCGGLLVPAASVEPTVNTLVCCNVCLHNKSYVGWFES